MKKKKETKKLTLNKITIAQLDKDIINRAKGGIEESTNTNGTSNTLTLDPPWCSPSQAHYVCNTQDGNC